MGPSGGSGIHTSGKDKNMVHSKKQTKKQRKVNKLIDTERGVRLGERGEGIMKHKLVVTK